MIVCVNYVTGVASISHNRTFREHFLDSRKCSTFRPIKNKGFLNRFDK